MPPATLLYDGFNFSFPQYRASGNDNIISDGQRIEVPRGRYVRVSMLAAAESGLAGGSINATYADGSQTAAQVLVPAWWNWPYPFGGDLVMPYHFANESIDYNRSNIFQTTNWLDPTKELTSLTLPVPIGEGSGVGGGEIATKLHVFAVSLLPAAADFEGGDMPQLEIQHARTTQKWIEGTNKTQVVEVILNNVGSKWLLANQTATVSVESPGLKTAKPAYVKRLRPGDQVIAEVGVVNEKDIAPGTEGIATVVVKTEDGALLTTQTIEAVYGIRDYEPTYDSVYGHESPDWFNDAKFGIFIHWGVYAVPGWGNVDPNESYAEWYWWSVNDPTNHAFQDYHLKTYGPDVVYDDFIANFTASAFSARDWVDLFAESGAQYFVQVSKHHDGYAIFDIPAEITERTSVALAPHRDFIGELFAAAREYQPHLHRAVYFSLPEWFHPDYKGLGFGSWPGGNATNPFTNETLPYAGYVPVDDFVADLIVPEMEILALDERYETEIMWCDIGGPNDTARFAAEWFNAAAARGRQVSLNARCGLPGDFDTPEYARYAAVQRRKWESNLGMDPFSYGYNRATPEGRYLEAGAIVTSLVDIVAKNGNLLLDVGPTAEGHILDVMQRHLRAAGAWIADHGEALFNTTYWAVTPQCLDPAARLDARFTTTPDAFYVLLLNETATGAVDLRDTPVPWLPGDRVTVVGGARAGEPVRVESLDGGRGLRLHVTPDMWKADKWAWVFKIEY